VDPLLLMLQLLLTALGVLGVAAAAPDLTVEHAGRALVGFALVATVAYIPTRWVVRVTPLAYLVTVALLGAVLVVGVSPDGLDARRWLALGGLPMTLQPSELMKVVIIAYLASFFHNHRGNWEIWRPMVVVGLAAGLVMAQPNISTAVFIFLLAFAIMVASGTSLQRLLSITTAAGVVASVIGAPYLSRLEYLGRRWDGFLGSLSGEVDVQGIGFQADRARAALQGAGLFGIGPGRPVRVPEAETDMIAVAIGQSLGLLGAAVLVLLFALMVGRIFQIASLARGPSALLAAGTGLYIGGQAAINLLVAAGLMPITGVPLPLVSYGFNSMLSVSVALGFVHAAFRQARAAGAPL
jgi:cell division protein FtsW